MAGVTLVTAAAADPISLADAKGVLRIDGSIEDATLYAYIRAAVHHVESVYGLALINQTLEATLDAFPVWSVAHGYDLLIPRPPLQSIISITYVDLNGFPQSLTGQDYEVDVKSFPGRVRPTYGQSWPSTRPVLNALTVRYVAGWGPGPAAVPGDVRLGLLGLVANFYTYRDTAGIPPQWIDMLLDNYRAALV